MKKALIFVEPEYEADAVDLLDVVKRMFQTEDYETYAAAINYQCKSILGKFNYFLQIDEQVENYDHMAISDILVQLNIKYHFDCIIFSASTMGRLLAPMVAAKIKTGLVADVTEIGRSKDEILLIRPAYSGRIMAGISVTGKGPVMLSVRPGVLKYVQNKSVKTTIVKISGLPFKKGSIKLLQKIEKKIDYDIRDSEILVSGGAGIQKNFAAIKPLAAALKAQVSASKAVVEKGIVERNIQVGQSGKTVSPKLYIALGIFGAIQHVVGLKNVDYIITVNTNSNAPICSMSDIVVEGDAFIFIEKLVNRINRRKE